MRRVSEVASINQSRVCHLRVRLLTLLILAHFPPRFSLRRRTKAAPVTDILKDSDGDEKKTKTNNTGK